MKLILASASPRRKQLLHDAGFTFEVITAETDERFPDGLSPTEAAKHIALDKAKAVREKLKQTSQWMPETVIIASDTIVVLENEIIGKPTDRAHAKTILERLSAKRHEVITAVCLMEYDNELCFSSTTHVYFNALSQSQIDFYLDRFQPYDKAGAYAIQEWIGLVGIEKIEGDFYNVMGLPINAVAQKLNALH